MCSILICVSYLFAGAYMGAAVRHPSQFVQPLGSQETFTNEEYWTWLAQQGQAQHQAQMQGQGQRPGGRRPRVTRKLSADSLLDYRTYQLEDSTGLAAVEPQYATLMHPGGHQQKNSNSYTSLSSLASGTMTSSKSRQGIDSEGKGMGPPSSRIRDLQLARKPLQIKIEEFRSYKPESDLRKSPSGERAVDGLLSIHIYCGHGLKSSRTMLRDLYCVIEVDAVNKARTMIRTGAINFDWDEEFDVDLETARELSFLVYSWDPNTRHRLCFSGTITLQSFLQYGNTQKIALKLEPKGVLYLEFNYKEPAISLQRTPSMRKNALFGVDLETVIKREKSGYNVPILLRRCVEEVERRGLDHVGIYRLCGSAKRKAQLKEEFQRDAKNVDLSPDNVSDINVITGGSKLAVLCICRFHVFILPFLLLLFYRQALTFHVQCIRGDVKIHRLQLPYSAASCSQPT